MAVKSEMGSLRQGTHASKTRAEVRGGGRKPWRQKGTGRSRIGSIRNPSRVHGGTAFGPEPREYNDKVNRKVKSIARKSALSQKIKSKLFKIVDDLSSDSFKTKDFNEILNNLEINNIKLTMIVGDNNRNLYLSCKNLNYINLVSAKNVSTYDIVNSNMLLLDKTSVEFLNESLQ